MGVQVSSVAQSFPTLCDPMDYRMPGYPVHHQVLELTQTHVHQVSDAIQPSHLMSSPSPPAVNLSWRLSSWSELKEFTIWDTVSPGLYFDDCTSPSLAAKNIFSLISVLTIWWCPCVESSLVLLWEDVCYDQCVVLTKLCKPLSCFVLHSKAELACYSRCLLTSYFCIPVPYN